ncbi:prepronociceptin b [Takifugu rubripes]|uniref:prepronociceptin b n=1 Tax=Takifugu rubripes TaxID=31033 RepID=UPI001146008D|nr:prepronociceptin [Takifugu rubripes]
MKIPLWYLVVLLACLFTPGRSDCQGECVACGLLMQQQLQQAFNTMVCLLECEGRVSGSLTWEVCQHVMKVPRDPTPPVGGVASSRTGEELGLTSFELLESAAAESFQDGDQDEASFEQRSVQYDSALVATKRGNRGEERNVEVNSPITRDQDEIPEALALSKRFGGFQRGRHGYRKLIGSSMRPLQKRYGGFIGVRKSARKWNSQKRVNQLLRQYLGMRSSRSGRFNVPMTRLWMQN